MARIRLIKLSVIILLFLVVNPGISYTEAQENNVGWYENFQIHGALLGYYGFFDMNDGGNSNQFNAAVNLDAEIRINDRLMGGFQIQAAPGGDDIGFSTQMAITDLYITYETPMEIFFTLGSFDTPFGDQTEVVTNNGDGLRNPFVINSLFMSAWGGTVGTLNTLGIMAGKETDVWDFRVAITNGTSESVSNSDENLEFVVDAGVNIGQWGRIAASFIDSDDNDGGPLVPGTGAPAFVTGMGAHLQAYIVDGKLNLPFLGDESYVKGYFGQADFDDNVATTQDGLTFWMVEGKHEFTQKFYAAARFSAWLPDDNNGNGTGISSALVSPGIMGAGRNITTTTATPTPILTDQDVTRLQLGVGYWAWDTVVLKATFFYDDYDKLTASGNTDIAGGLLSINLGF